MVAITRASRVKEKTNLKFKGRAKKIWIPGEALSCSAFMQSNCLDSHTVELPCSIVCLKNMASGTEVYYKDCRMDRPCSRVHSQTWPITLEFIFVKNIWEEIDLLRKIV